MNIEMATEAKSGATIYFPFLLGKEVDLPVSCAKCGQVKNIPLVCTAPTDPREVSPEEFACANCGEMVRYMVFFYQPYTIVDGTTSHFNGQIWLGLDLPVVIRCPECGELSSKILVPCSGFNRVEVKSKCKCRRPLNATIDFFLA